MCGLELVLDCIWVGSEGSIFEGEGLWFSIVGVVSRRGYISRENAPSRAPISSSTPVINMDSLSS